MHPEPPGESKGPKSKAVGALVGRKVVALLYNFKGLTQDACSSLARSAET